MTFRRRIVVLAAGAVAAAVALASVVTFVVVRHELRAGVDASLRKQRPKGDDRQPRRKGDRPRGRAGRRRQGHGPDRLGRGARSAAATRDEFFQAQLPSTGLGGTAGLAQVTLSDGQVILSAAGAKLPTTAAVREVARGRRSESFRGRDRSRRARPGAHDTRSRQVDASDRTVTR